MLVAAANASADPSPDTNLLAFHCALARQCFVNEYVFACTNDEQAQVDLLRQKLTAALQTEEVIPVLWIAAVAAYAPLSELPSSAMLLERPWPESVASLLVQQVAEPREETQYRENIPRLTAIDDAVSRQVQQQYEENPYPRWIKVHGAAKRSSLNGYLLQQFPLAAFEPLPNDSEIEILIAGCGTGQEATEAALQISAKRVLAIDLSLTSLAYAKRKTLEAGVDNIEYAQGDILRLASIDRKFDMVAASGVLHHLADPTIGWRALLALLRPGGFMRVALYSERARRDVVTARQFIAERGYLPTASDIRRMRQDLAESADRFGGVTSLRDFYVMSECRDLLFHVQEHRFTLPGIKDLLAALGLRFIGFLLDPQTVRAYRTRFPHDPSLSDLDAWDAFEAQFPDTFMGMYCFWVQKPR